MEKRDRRSCASGTHWTCSSPSGPGYPWSLTWQYSACKCPVRKNNQWVRHLLLSSRIPRWVNRGESRIWVPFTRNWQKHLGFCFNLLSVSASIGTLTSNHLRGSPPFQIYKLTKALKTPENSKWHLYLLRRPVYNLNIPHTENAMILARFGSSGELILISSGCYFDSLAIKMEWWDEN